MALFLVLTTSSNREFVFIVEFVDISVAAESVVIIANKQKITQKLSNLRDHENKLHNGG